MQVSVTEGHGLEYKKDRGAHSERVAALSGQPDVMTTSFFRCGHRLALARVASRCWGVGEADITTWTERKWRHAAVQQGNAQDLAGSGTSGEGKVMRFSAWMLAFPLLEGRWDQMG